MNSCERKDRCTNHDFLSPSSSSTVGFVMLPFQQKMVWKGCRFFALQAQSWRMQEDQENSIRWSKTAIPWENFPKETWLTWSHKPNQAKVHRVFTPSSLGPKIPKNTCLWQPWRLRTSGGWWWRAIWPAPWMWFPFRCSTISTCASPQSHWGQQGALGSSHQRLKTCGKNSTFLGVQLMMSTWDHINRELWQTLTTSYKRTHGRDLPL